MLALEGISKYYEGHGAEAINALEALSLRFAGGSFVVIVGSNGSGKSTLLNLIAGSERVASGRILLDGEDITAQPEHQRAARIGRVFQNPFRGTVPDMTVEENLALAARRGRSFDLGFALTRELRDEIHARLADLGIGLEARMTQPVAALSGGQRQIVTMLMATWERPRVLLLDEHTAALDPQSADLVLQITGQIVNTGNLTVLMVTHSMQQAVHFGDRLVMLHRGRLALDISGSEKNRAQPGELIHRFEELRRAELLDETVGILLKEQYV
ncbi:MAG: ATP-binding cassette domain-containing protein [Bacteroidota bacterium]|nr:ATP-binding cassette domain-containing protein [Bacteroidota bacterium]